MVDIDKWLVETNIQFDNIKKGELSIFFKSCIKTILRWAMRIQKNHYM